MSRAFSLKRYYVLDTEKQLLVNNPNFRKATASIHIQRVAWKAETAKTTVMPPSLP